MTANLRNADDENNENKQRLLEEAPLFADLSDSAWARTVAEAPPKVEPVPVARANKASKKPDSGAQHRASKKASLVAKPVSPKASVQPEKKAKPDPVLLSVLDMCALLGVSRATLVRMDNRGEIPGRLKLGGSVRYHRETVESWLKTLINS